MTDIMAYPQHYDSIYRIRITRYHADSPRSVDMANWVATGPGAPGPPAAKRSRYRVHPTGVTYHSHSSLSSGIMLCVTQSQSSWQPVSMLEASDKITGEGFAEMMIDIGP
jgi:hypothetical protein